MIWTAPSFRQSTHFQLFSCLVTHRASASLQILGRTLAQWRAMSRNVGHRSFVTAHHHWSLVTLSHRVLVEDSPTSLSPTALTALTAVHLIRVTCPGKVAQTSFRSLLAHLSSEIIHLEYNISNGQLSDVTGSAHVMGRYLANAIVSDKSK